MEGNLIGGRRPLAGDELTFEKDIRPIFRANCFDCHGATDEKEGQLDLRQVRLMILGGESGSAIEKGNAADSLLLERMVSGEMPPGDHRVPEEDIAKIKSWIESGAPTARAEPEEIPAGLGITLEEREYWAFQPIRRPAVPPVKATDRVRTPVDAFLLAAMEPKGLTLAGDAEKSRWIRRASLDLLGLPPSPEQVKKFLGDSSPDAWDRVVEELLASEHYGERWGRHWLDVAGYADSEGASERDPVRPWAYKYRDWVIRALNEDMPFDQFIQWQLAGDELVSLPLKNLSPREIDQLTATGFLRMARDGTAVTNNDENRNAVVVDTIDIVSSSLLGLSVKCAQCHDHRYDPISHEDYHRLRAVFEPALNYRQWRVPNSRLVSLYTDADHAKAAAIEKQAVARTAEKNKKQAEYMKQALESVLAGVTEDLREPLREAYQTPGNKRTEQQKALLKKHPSVGSFSPGVLYQYNQKHADELKAMDAEIAGIRAKKPVHEYLRSLAESKSSEIPKTQLFHRGDYRQPKHEVQPGGLTVCAPEESPLLIPANDTGLPTTGRRLAYARWLTSGRHPLVARVLVNRIWLHHFGRTFVSTPEEFGKLGTRPTHPQLLDWLADEFMAKGWSLKNLHRLILGSTVYRQASQRHERGDSVDRMNELYWHFPVHRLEAEVIRDSALAVGNRLDLETRFGKPVDTKQDDTGQVVVPGEKQRRSIYLQVRRSKPVSILESFDAPVMKVNCPSRESSTVATQSLMLMNSEFVLNSARFFANRLNHEAGGIELPEFQDRSIDELVRKALQKGEWSYGFGFLSAGSQEVSPGEAHPEKEKTVAAKDGSTVSFHPYPVFAGRSWKGGKDLPDPGIGWSHLTAHGGHPDSNHGSAIRRWTAPVGGTLRIKGRVTHSHPMGDGVELWLRSSRQGILRHEIAHNGSKDYSLELKVVPGEVLDTVVAHRTNHNFDSFANSFRIERLEGEKVIQTWDSAAEFPDDVGAGNPVSPVSRQIVHAWQLAYSRDPTGDEFSLASNFLLEQLKLLQEQGAKEPLRQAMINFCQVILGSNEFLYVD
ncbi:MAG: DUF1553 domain-containing protein [Planctomycetota bacterium]|nr:DUF1553 domain-containing protein [Planctomycetota bacterium]